MTFSGGSFNDLYAEDGSKLEVLGGEFRLDGIPIDGLDNVGTSLPFNLPRGSLLSGTLADGTPFALLGNFDEIANGSLTLTAVSLPPITGAEIVLPGAQAPQGLRAGQTLIVNKGGVVPNNFNAGLGSTVVIDGGEVGANFEAVGANISVRKGNVGFVDAFRGTTIMIAGGTITSFLADRGSIVTVSGGTIGAGNNPSGARRESEVNILGGVIGPFKADAGSVIDIFGTKFVLDNRDITSSLTANIPYIVAERNVTLSGLLLDGSPFSFDLSITGSTLGDRFEANATLTIILVPEPQSILLLIPIASASCLRRKLRGAREKSPELCGQTVPHRFSSPRLNAFA